MYGVNADGNNHVVWTTFGPTSQKGYLKMMT